LIKSIITFFDLNKQTIAVSEDGATALKDSEEVEMPDIILGARPVPGQPITAKRRGHKQEQSLSTSEQILLYCGTILGVFVSLIAHGSGQHSLLDLQANAGNLGLCLVLSISIIPHAYKTLEIPHGAPLFIRFLMFVENGVFWQVIFSFAGSFGRQ